MTVEYHNQSMIEGLRRLGYVQVAKNVFWAEWSSNDVAHYIKLRHYAYVRGTPAAYIQINFGFKNSPVQKFSRECAEKYVSEIFGKRLPRHHFDNRFFVHSGQYKNHSVELCEYNMTPEHIAEVIIMSAENYILPRVDRLLTLDAMLSVLVSDVEPLGWEGNNPILRSAQIIALAVMTGTRTVSELRKPIQPFEWRIRSQMHRSGPVEKFLDRVAADALEKF